MKHFPIEANECHEQDRTIGQANVVAPGVLYLWNGRKSWQIKYGQSRWLIMVVSF